MSDQPQPPLYLIIVNGNNHWLPLRQAGVAYDSGWVAVSIGGRVIEENGTERAITDQERQQIATLADEHSASK